MGQTRAILCGYYGKGNGGDEALLASLLQMLPEQITPLVLSAIPAQTSKRYGVESCNRMSALQVIRAMHHSDAFIWGGGSLIQDATSIRNPLYYCGLMGLAQQLGLKTIAWAQGIGPLQHQLTRFVGRQSFAGCTAVSVRDSASAAFLADWQIPFLQAPDPVWALDSLPVKGLWDLPAPRVAVTWRSHSSLTPKRLANLTKALVDFQKATQTCILLVPFQVSQDLSIAQSIAAELTGSHQILIIEEPRQLKGLFRGVEMVIGMRYHSLIMAAAQECRCFALSYDPKVTQLMAQLNLPGWDLAKLPEDPNFISQTWLQHYVNGNSLNSDQIQSLVDRAMMHREVLLEVFPTPS
ncbi:MAG: polysaccharide pyruvyl transferase CsaB [Symploca sp. SIO3C6]|uniref:Polysaccharide pyruvyl transferase CsaB n=1 Tax=Symploca sp. SIO1C4 TaxID=2607765 RepID=A0A6B3NHL5_9CYAN|nr:polysaccharide pyruvyl transferase CsaB [Symploca sp. SIO3C6]NER31190.1 polysaccharide pyruvyl transferase CsaB [Symploca sp. SIO1C4]